MPGHVFITRGDMRRMVCDAWCLPCDATCRVVPAWLTEPEGFPLEAGEEYLSRIRERYFEPTTINYYGHKIHRFVARPDRLDDIDEWGPDTVRVAALKAWDPEWGPRPWLTNVGSSPKREIDWFVEGMRQYLWAANLALKDAEPRCGRIRPLVAVHAVGTGMGGAAFRKAQVIWRQLEAMYEFAARSDCAVDLVFVAWEQSAFAAAQACRRTGLRDPETKAKESDASPPERFWPELTERHREVARSLARRAASGNLVLFLGAGVSMPAGLPGWTQLLEEAAGSNDHLRTRTDALRGLDPLDQAQIVERYVDLRETVARRLQPAAAALGHALLASLPVNEFVTQNFDRLFEMAAFAAGNPVAVIPGTRVADEHRWLLKMHGSVDRPDEIVLTREDYLRYGERRAALAGIVQALLITKHMVFIGFSLSDPNFHRIADDVRKVLRPASKDGADGEGTFGSVLLLLRDELRESLWDRDLSVVSFGEADATFPAAARLHDIFLDYLLYESTASASYLLDPDYEHALSSRERDLRDALNQLKRFKRTLGGTPTWDAVARLLHELGSNIEPGHP